ncbi:MAG: hypothetical protein VYE68_16410 [Acidobacteriota bacterium]|nr:hypothetical protein [Acidobacteriota bacterium]
MSRQDERDEITSCHSLEDNDITIARVDRRSFLARAAGAGTLVLGAVITTACGDSCDDDTIWADTDLADPANIGDICDADSSGSPSR